MKHIQIRTHTHTQSSALAGSRQLPVWGAQTLKKKISEYRARPDADAISMQPPVQVSQQQACHSVISLPHRSADGEKPKQDDGWHCVEHVKHMLVFLAKHLKSLDVFLPLKTYWKMFAPEFCRWSRFTCFPNSSVRGWECGGGGLSDQCLCKTLPPALLLSCV